jgi:hypothetical protein
MWSGACLTSKLYDKIIKTPSKSHETIPLRILSWLAMIYLELASGVSKFCSIVLSIITLLGYIYMNKSPVAEFTNKSNHRP